MLKGLNHITLAVKDINESFYFYTHILGFKAHAKWDKGAYLTLGNLWLCLNLDSVETSNDCTHISFDIEECDFVFFKNKIEKYGCKIWKKNTSEGNSLYIKDPNNHKLEIHVGTLKSRLESLNVNNFKDLKLFNEDTVT